MAPSTYYAAKRREIRPPAGAVRDAVIGDGVDAELVVTSSEVLEKARPEMITWAPVAFESSHRTVAGATTGGGAESGCCSNGCQQFVLDRTTGAPRRPLVPDSPEPLRRRGQSLPELQVQAGLDLPSGVAG